MRTSTASVIRYRERNPDTWRQRHREANARWRRRNVLKKRAYSAVEYALKAGNLVREPCLFCGDLSVEAHHHDYALPLCVTWLCRKHHGLVHRNLESA